MRVIEKEARRVILIPPYSQKTGREWIDAISKALLRRDREAYNRAIKDVVEICLGWERHFQNVQDKSEKGEMDGAYRQWAVEGVRESVLSLRLFGAVIGGFVVWVGGMTGVALFAVGVLWAMYIDISVRRKP